MSYVIKKWMSAAPKDCQICGYALMKFFIDGRTLAGPWGILCTECHAKRGVGLGEGRGQKYNLDTLVKVEG